MSAYRRLAISIILEFSAGGAMGLLVGLLVGFSVSPIVGTILGALAALLITFLGLQERSAPDTGAPPATATRSLRATGFGFACVIGILLGIFVRTHGLLSVSVKDQIAVWKQAGFPDADSRVLVAYQQLGIVPAGWSIGAEAVALQQKTAGSVLFSEKAASHCSDLEPERYKNISEGLNAFILTGGGWATIARKAAEVPDQYQRPLLDAAWRLVCAE